MSYCKKYIRSSHQLFSQYNVLCNRCADVLYAWMKKIINRSNLVNRYLKIYEIWLDFDCNLIDLIARTATQNQALRASKKKTNKRKHILFYYTEMSSTMNISGTFLAYNVILCTSDFFVDVVGSKIVKSFRGTMQYL